MEFVSLFPPFLGATENSTEKYLSSYRALGQHPEEKTIVAIMAFEVVPIQIECA